MRFARLLVLGAVVLASGCAQSMCQSGCNSCGGRGNAYPARVGQVPHGHGQEIGPAGPPTAAYAYPYYSLRGPRDFLLDNPPSIGP